MDELLNQINNNIREFDEMRRANLVKEMSENIKELKEANQLYKAYLTDRYLGVSSCLYEMSQSP